MELELFRDDFEFPFPEEAQATPPELRKSFLIGGTSLDVFKAHSPKFKGRLIIEGECSNTDRDMDGESIIAKGMDIDYARKQGKILWGHTPRDRAIDPRCILGIPLEIKPFEKSIYTIDELNPAMEYAVAVYKAMAGLPGRHGISFSIEGGAILRDPKDPTTVQKSWLQNIALDKNVKNTSTWADIRKAFGIEIEKAQTTATIAPLTKEDLSPIMTSQVFDGLGTLPADEFSYYFTKHPITKKPIFKSFARAKEFFMKKHGLSEQDTLDVLRHIRRNPICQ